jgi:drug/metabolite transporter (DMT)-like permease
MGIPYMLYSIGLRYISAQEGLIIALGEPVLNPIIVWFAVQEVPAELTIIGGSFIVMGLLVFIKELVSFSVVQTT